MPYFLNFGVGEDDIHFIQELILGIKLILFLIFCSCHLTVIFILFIVRSFTDIFGASVRFLPNFIPYSIAPLPIPFYPLSLPPSYYPSYPSSHRPITLPFFFHIPSLPPSPSLSTLDSFPHTGDAGEAPEGFVWRGRGKKTFLYDIVANKRNGVDVDRFDYFRRYVTKLYDTVFFWNLGPWVPVSIFQK